jgi:hypothetical protein
MRTQGHRKRWRDDKRVAAPYLAIATVILTTLGIVAPAAAQPVLTGTVVSSADSTPVPRATVTVETWDGQFVAEATSDVEGRFRMAFEEPGTFVVSAAGPGYARSELQRVDLDPDQPTEIRLEVTPREMPESRPRLPEVEAAAGEIAGRVIDASSGRPIPGATVTLLARRDDDRIATVTAGSDGEFRLRAPETTTYRLRADLGDFGRSETLIVEGSTERGLSLTLELISDPVELEAITAEGRREIFWWQQEKPVWVWPYSERRHFYQRLAMGRFYDGQYLQEWGHMSAYAFLRSHTFPASRRSEACARIGVFLDGRIVGVYHMGQEGLPPRQRSETAQLQNAMVNERLAILSTEDLEGVEVYREGAFNPPDLLPPSSEFPPYCEVVAVWQRRDSG